MSAILDDEVLELMSAILDDAALEAFERTMRGLADTFGVIVYDYVWRLLCDFLALVAEPIDQFYERNARELGELAKLSQGEIRNRQAFKTSRKGIDEYRQVRPMRGEGRSRRGRSEGRRGRLHQRVPRRHDVRRHRYPAGVSHASADINGSKMVAADAWDRRAGTGAASGSDGREEVPREVGAITREVG